MPENVAPQSRVPVAARWLTLALIPVFVVVVNLFFHRVQLHLWNNSGWLDFLAMIALIAPFIATRWFGPAHQRATRVLWWLCAVMAIDVLAFFFGTFLPSGGHPSLEALASYFLGWGKVVLVPAGLIALAVASWKGERTLTVGLGLACLIGETLYTVIDPGHPFRWMIFMRGPS